MLQRTHTVGRNFKSTKYYEYMVTSHQTWETSQVNAVGIDKILQDKSYYTVTEWNSLESLLKIL